MSHAPISSLPRSAPFKDARLPPGYGTFKTATGAVEIRSSEDVYRRLLLAFILLLVALASMRCVYSTCVKIVAAPPDLDAQLPTLIVYSTVWVASGLGFWRAAEGEMLAVDHNLFVVKRSFFGLERCSRFTDACIALQPHRDDGTNYFVLRILQGGKPSWFYHEGGRFPTDHLWPLSFGLLLQEVTGWEFLVPENLHTDRQ